MQNKYGSSMLNKWDGGLTIEYFSMSSANRTLQNYPQNRPLDRKKVQKKRALARPHKKKTEDVFTHPPFLLLAV